MTAAATEGTRRAAPITFRHPGAEDGGRVWAFIRDSGGLELNSTYAYLLLCSHFANTSLIAEQAGEVVGVVLGYRPPTDPTAVFVWQIGVGPQARGRGLGSELLDRLLTVDACRGVRFLTATVEVSNEASRRMFEGFAKRNGVACVVERGFLATDFIPANHEAEPLLRIGPLLETS